jgi:hypothetical protein
MSIARINEFRAKDGSADALRSFLARLIPTITGPRGQCSYQSQATGRLRSPRRLASKIGSTTLLIRRMVSEE